MFLFNPDGPFAWDEAVERHRRGGDGEALAAMIRSGKPMPDEAREYLASLASATAKRRRGRQAKGIDPATIFRDRRIQAAVSNVVRRVARRGSQERELRAQQRARGDEIVELRPVSQDAAVQAVVDAIAGTRDELQRTAVSELARRVGPPADDVEHDDDPTPPSVA